MNRTTARTAAFAAATIAATASFASAMPSGASAPGSIFIAEDAFVTISFVSYSAGWTGTLYRLEPSETSSMTMGEALFTNKTATPGETKSLGLIPGGTHLMFAYKVTTGKKNTFRMDESATSGMFAVAPDGANAWNLYVEDWVGGDNDYNDATFHLIGEPIPAPASLATAGLVLLGTGLRRRKA